MHRRSRPQPSQVPPGAVPPTPNISAHFDQVILAAEARMGKAIAGVEMKALEEIRDQAIRQMQETAQALKDQLQNLEGVLGAHTLVQAMEKGYIPWQTKAFEVEHNYGMPDLKWKQWDLRAGSPRGEPWFQLPPGLWRFLVIAKPVTAEDLKASTEWDREGIEMEKPGR